MVDKIVGVIVGLLLIAVLIWFGGSKIVDAIRAPVVAQLQVAQKVADDNAKAAERTVGEMRSKERANIALRTEKEFLERRYVALSAELEARKKVDQAFRDWAESALPVFVADRLRPYAADRQNGNGVSDARPELDGKNTTPTDLSNDKRKPP